MDLPRPARIFRRLQWLHVRLWVLVDSGWNNGLGFLLDWNRKGLRVDVPALPVQGAV